MIQFILIKGLLSLITAISLYQLLYGYPVGNTPEVEWVFWICGAYAVYKWKEFDWITPIFVVLAVGTVFVELERLWLMSELTRLHGPHIMITPDNNPYDSILVFGFLPGSYMGVLVLMNLMGFMLLGGFRVWESKKAKDAANA